MGLRKFDEPRPVGSKKLAARIVLYPSKFLAVQILVVVAMRIGLIFTNCEIGYALPQSRFGQ